MELRGTHALSATSATKAVRVTLSAGEDKIKAVATTASGGPNVDKITL